MKTDSASRLSEWLGTSEWKIALYDGVCSGEIMAHMHNSSVRLSSKRKVDSLVLEWQGDEYSTIAIYANELPNRFIAILFFRELSLPPAFFKEDVLRHLFHDPLFEKIRIHLQKERPTEYSRLLQFGNAFSLVMGGGDDGTYYRLAETLLLTVIASGFYDIAKNGIKTFVANHTSHRKIKAIVRERLTRYVYGTDASDFILELVLRLPNSRKRRTLGWLSEILAEDVHSELRARLKSLKNTEKVTQSIIDDVYGSYL